MYTYAHTHTYIHTHRDIDHKAQTFSGHRICCELYERKCQNKRMRLQQKEMARTLEARREHQSGAGVGTPAVKSR